MKALRILSPAALFALTLALPNSALRAADRSWTGLGSSGNWSDGANWITAPVTSGADGLIFAGSTRTATNNDFDGAQFNKITFRSTAEAFQLAGNGLRLGGYVTNESTFLQTISLDLELTAAIEFRATSGNLAATGKVSGNYSVTKAGAGVLTLSGSNSFNNLLIGGAGGTVRLTDAHASGSGYVDMRNDSAVVFGAGVGTFVFHGIGNSIGTASDGNIALTDEAGQAVTLRVVGSSDTYHSRLSGLGSLVIDLDEGGRQRLGSANTFAGSVTINSGVLALTGVNGNLSGVNRVAINGGTFDISRLLGGSKTVTVAALTGLGGKVIANTTTPAGVMATGTLVVNTATDDRFDGTLEDDAGRLALTKSGAGTLTLGGESAYTGATTVTGGILRIDGSLDGSNVTVQAGAALGGDGGAIRNGSLTLASGAAFDFVLSDTGVTSLTVDSVSLGANIGLRLALGAAAQADDRFTILEGYAGGVFATINGGLFGEGDTFQLSHGGNDYTFELLYETGSISAQVIDVIPEPGTASLLLGGLALVGAAALCRRGK